MEAEVSRNCTIDLTKQIFITSLSETFVNKLFMSNETIKLFGWKRLKLLSFYTKLKDSGTV